MFQHLLRWFFHKLNWQTLLLLLLPGIALASVVFTLADLTQGLGLPLLIAVALAGLLLGWTLGAAKTLPGWLAGTLIAILGSEIIIVQVAHFKTELTRLAQNGVFFIWQLWHWRPPNDLPDIAPFTASFAELWNGLETLAVRLFNWVSSIIMGVPAFDPVIAALVWGFALWLVSAWAGWVIRCRQKALAALLPAGVLLATTLAYHPKQAGNLLPIVGAGLLLMGLTRHLTLEHRWKINKIDFPLFRTELTFVVILITALLLFVAAAVPSISVRQLAQQIQKAFKSPVSQADTLFESLGLEAKPAGTTKKLPHNLVAPGLPRRHLLGSGPELSEQVVMTISTNKSPSPRYYWRALTYDQYNGRGWVTSRTDVVDFEAGETVLPVTGAEQQILQQTVQMFNTQEITLYTTGNLITVNHPYSIRRRGSDDLFAVIINTDSYQVDSLISTPANETNLRSAGIDYPNSIHLRHLRLPKETPDRLFALSRDLTATALTPYDRAKAIETYLRTIPYSLDLPQPPPEQDIVEYFLFNLQTGYCDYYATSMVVLARAAGLPARLAVGYTGGTYVPEKEHYLITEADAHAWPEIYFPEYGWIEFEPTAAQSVINRTGKADATTLEEPLPALTSSQETVSQKTIFWWLVGLGVIIVPATVGASWWLVDSWRLRHMTPEATIGVLYKRLLRHGQRLSVTPHQGDTPYEFAATFTASVNKLAQGNRWSKPLSPISQNIQQLTHLYVQTAYSNHLPTGTIKTRALNAWVHLRWRLWFAWLVSFVAKSREQ